MKTAEWFIIPKQVDVMFWTSINFKVRSIWTQQAVAAENTKAFLLKRKQIVVFFKP